MLDTRNIATDLIDPNGYNPNAMTDAEFAELVEEVRHLGRIPKPVIVRPAGLRFLIIDGEHGWRAAKTVGLSEIPCEVIEADDFEAMRQTYKRNQHGTHNPVLLGRMFRQMMEARNLSQRALAGEICVSEGTIRNALLYADAADLRNGYAFGNLGVRQIRMYLSLPVVVRDAWLDSGADIQAVLEAGKITVKKDGKPFKAVYEPGDYHVLEEYGVLDAVSGKSREAFMISVRYAFELVEKCADFGEIFPCIQSYVRPVARLRVTPDVLDCLPCERVDDEIQMLILPELWDSIITSCLKLTDSRTEFLSMVRASLKLHFREIGKTWDEKVDPRALLMQSVVDDGPDFIRDSGLSLKDKYYLAVARATVECPEEILLEAKQKACARVKARDDVLKGTLDGRHLPDDVLPFLRSQVEGVTAESALNEALNGLLFHKEMDDQDSLFDDREQLIIAVTKEIARQTYNIRTGQIADKPATDVLRERLARLPQAELFLLAGYVLAVLSGPQRWLNTVRDEAESE
jgi:ParB/RepB/Spo0J family partition protein